jgi:hypothetical protein
MTLNLGAIFGAETGDAPTTVIVDPPVDDPFPDVPDDPAEQLPGDFGAARPAASWPIIEGTEHFSIWVDDPAGEWPEFVPGLHYDLRQPSRLRPLCRGKIQ